MYTYIYGLKCPLTKQIRYVGKSNAPERRYFRHTGLYGENTHKDSWVKKLALLGLKPELVIIEKVLASVWVEKEKYYIAYFKSLGIKLINKTDGGEGIHNYHHTKATRRKLSLSHIGKKMSEEHKRKISEATKGRKKPFGFGEKLSKSTKGTKLKGKKVRCDLCDSSFYAKQQRLKRDRVFCSHRCAAKYNRNK